MIFHERIHELVEPRQLADRVALERRTIEKILVPVNDHPELGAPVAEMIVADRAVPEKLQDSIQRVADHRRANVAYVHRLGNVRP